MILFLMSDKKLHYFQKYEEKINHRFHLHPKLVKQILSFPSELSQFGKHIIFYGPSGVGKYTLALKLIRRYSNSKLKYEKKMMISSGKTIFAIKMSDIHYEIDMSTLGCNSKLLWHDIFIQLIDTISTKHSVIIVCKCFHEINPDLLEIFYSYMQPMNNKMCFGVDIRFVLLTEHLSFIPDNILTGCKVVSVARPSVSRYKKCMNFVTNGETEINNIANHLSINCPLHPFDRICKEIVCFLLHLDPSIKLIKVRDYIYEMLVYNLNIHDATWFILKHILPKVKQEKQFNVVFILYKFFHFYNNNYRPIYHFEWLLFTLFQLIHCC